MSASAREIAVFDPAVSNEGALSALADRVGAFYAKKPGPCCTALCLLALRSNNRTTRQTALETLDLWVQDEKDPLREDRGPQDKGACGLLLRRCQRRNRGDEARWISRLRLGRRRLQPCWPVSTPISLTTTRGGSARTREDWVVRLKRRPTRPRTCRRTPKVQPILTAG